MINCNCCNKPIPNLRIDAWFSIYGNAPEYCADCADSYTEQTRAFMDYAHKTGGELVVARGHENIRRASRIFNRER